MDAAADLKQAFPGHREHHIQLRCLLFIQRSDLPIYIQCPRYDSFPPIFSHSANLRLLAAEHPLGDPFLDAQRLLDVHLDLVSDFDLDFVALALGGLEGEEGVPWDVDCVYGEDAEVGRDDLLDQQWRRGSRLI